MLIGFSRQKFIQESFNKYPKYKRAKSYPSPFQKLSKRNIPLPNIPTRKFLKELEKTFFKKFPRKS